jgi:dimethylamine monooxygenase subunit C
MTTGRSGVRVAPAFSFLDCMLSFLGRGEHALLASEVKSRPVYLGLEPDMFASNNIIVCDRAGVTAVIDMLAKAGAEFAGRTTVILSADEYPDQKAIDLDIARLQPARTTALPGIDAAAAALGERLFRAQMGTRIYAAGSEPLIGSAVQRAMRFGIDQLSVRTEHRGSLKRRVQCVHCKTLIENVTAQPVKCTGCGQMLTVRDHYSRRYAAFIGVRVDAEVPGEIPEQVPFQ